MVIQSLIAKVAVVTLATGIVGSSIAVPVVLTSGDKVSQVEMKKNEPNLSECFVIPTAEGDNQAQLLMCEVKEATSRGRDEQNYWYRAKSGTGVKNTKVTKISKKGNGLEITLEGVDSLMQLTLSPDKLENWEHIAESTVLNNSFELIKEELNIKWQSFTSAGMADITLTKFSGK